MLYMLLVDLFGKLPDLFFVCVTINLIVAIFKFYELLFSLNNSFSYESN